jgi:biotin carboxyl carrier protein
MRYFVTIADRTVEVDLSGPVPRVDGVEVATELASVPGTPMRSLIVAGRSHAVIAEAGNRRGRWALQLGAYRYDVEVVDERTRAIREMTGGAEIAAPKTVLAPMPGLVVRVEVEPGQTVHAGQGVVVVEAMKMENELKARAEGVVSRVEVQPGHTVEKGATLVVLE